MYVAAAENDPTCPPEQLDLLEKAYTAAGVAHTIETYPAAHGFAVPENGGDDEAAAERHWRRWRRSTGPALGDWSFGYESSCRRARTRFLMPPRRVCRT